MKSIRPLSQYRFIRPIIELGRRVKFAFVRMRIRSSVTHISGLRKIKLSKDGVIVLCLVKNGELVIEDFINYYLDLGVEHMIFLDNGSQDQTAELASKYTKVTVLRSHFPFRNDGDMRLREYLTDYYGYGRWSLCVDIDEYFDYPHSNLISLNQFIKYLINYGYTAVVTQMLDMFPEQLQRQRSTPFIRSAHKYYMIDNLVKEKYRIWDSGRAALPVNPDHASITGGIRKALFDASPSLTKHALIYHSSKTRRDKWGHFLDKGVVADVSCVLLHYKFTSVFFQQVEEAVKKEHHFRNSSEYKQYHHVLKDLTVIDFPISNASIWSGVDKLIEQNLLNTSSAYEQWSLSIG